MVDRNNIDLDQDYLPGIYLFEFLDLKRSLALVCLPQTQKKKRTKTCVMLNKPTNYLPALGQGEFADFKALALSRYLSQSF